MNPTTQPVQWPESKLLIRFSDCDMYGHLNNTWYLKYFLDAREDHIADSYGLSLAHFARLGVGWVVSSNQIVYQRPALVNEQVMVRSAVMEFSATEALVEMQMHDLRRTHLKAVMWSRFVHVNLKDGKRTTHSPEITTLFESVKLGGYSESDFSKRVTDLRSEQSQTVPVQ